jgi:hypothetical protein
MHTKKSILRIVAASTPAAAVPATDPMGRGASVPHFPETKEIAN